MAAPGLSSLFNVYQDLAMAAYRNGNAQQMVAANNGLVMANQLQNLAGYGGAGNMASIGEQAGVGGTCGSTLQALALQSYAQPSQLRYTVPGSILRGELDENLNTAEEIAKIKAEAAYNAQKVNFDIMYGRAALARPMPHGRIVHETADDLMRSCVTRLQSKEPKTKAPPKLSLKTTPLFKHLRWKFDSPFAPVSRAFAKWVLSWRYT